MALLQQVSDKEKVLKVELPDGTKGDIPIVQAENRTEFFEGFRNGGKVETFGLMGDSRRKYNSGKKKKKK